MSDEMQSVFMVVQEAPGEQPSTATVSALSGEAALARVPEMAKDFFGEIPKAMVTWRVERYLGIGRWTIYACEWSSEKGETVAQLQDVPASVLMLIMRYAGANDGIARGLDEKRMLVDLDGSAKQCAIEFTAWDGVSDEKRALAEFAYAQAWSSGLNDVLAAKFRGRLGAKKGQT